MTRTLALGSMVLLFFLSGCSDGDAPPAASSTTTSTAEQITNATDLPGGKVLPPPRELYNESFRYPRLPNEAPFAGTFDVDNSTQQLEFKMESSGDCPVYSGFSRARVEFKSPSGEVVVLDRFGTNYGDMWTGSCPTGQATGQKDLGASLIVVPSEVGTWTLASKGSFTGNVRLTATANPLP